MIYQIFIRRLFELLKYQVNTISWIRSDLKLFAIRIRNELDPEADSKITWNRQYC